MIKMASAATLVFAVLLFNGAFQLVKSDIGSANFDKDKHFVTKLSDIWTVIGENVEICCGEYIDPKLYASAKVRWSKNGVRMQEATNNTLNIFSMHPYYGGKYDCFVDNGDLSDHAIFKIHVREDRKEKNKSWSTSLIKIRPGRPLILQCNAVHLRKNETQSYTWKKNGGLIKMVDYGTYHMFFTPNKKQMVILNFNAVDIKSFECCSESNTHEFCSTYDIEIIDANSKEEIHYLQSVSRFLEKDNYFIQDDSDLVTEEYDSEQSGVNMSMFLFYFIIPMVIILTLLLFYAVRVIRARRLQRDMDASTDTVNTITVNDDQQTIDG